MLPCVESENLNVVGGWVRFLAQNLCESCQFSQAKYRWGSLGRQHQYTPLAAAIGETLSVVISDLCEAHDVQWSPLERVSMLE